MEYQVYLWLVFSVGLSGTVHNHISHLPVCLVMQWYFSISLMCHTLFCSSTVSSGLNSLAAVVLEDFIKPWCRNRQMHLSEIRATLYSKLLGEQIC